MTHSVSDKQLALYSTGDLTSIELELVSRHLAECPQCSGRLAEFAELQRVFVGLRVEPALDDLREVHVSTMQAVDRLPRHRNIWKWASAATAAIAFLLLLRANREDRAVPPNTAAVRHAPESIVRSALPVQPAHAVRRFHTQPAARLKSIALLTAADREPTIKITTSDPNVIILLPAEASPHERTRTDD